MKVKIAILAVLVLAGAFGAHKVNQFRSSPSGQLIETLQERKQLIEDFQKSPTLQIPTKQ
jgi:outer membrane murein-binding lipoprotein Lpp